MTLIHDLDPFSPVLLLATCEERYDDLDFSVSMIFYGVLFFPLQISFHFKKCNTSSKSSASDTEEVFKHTVIRYP